MGEIFFEKIGKSCDAWLVMQDVVDVIEYRHFIRFAMDCIYKGHSQSIPLTAHPFIEEGNAFTIRVVSTLT